jgi:pimeloyl-ACP methyl ester carboxylesterase
VPDASEQITPFRLAVSDDELTDLSDRLRRTRWPDRAPVDDWSQGIPLPLVRSLCRYWLEDYDWRAREARMNGFAQFRTEIDGLGIHFLHVRSPHPGAMPLLLTHGWPGSFVEFLDVIDPLSDPTSHGGDASDAFDVVVPSLPGYGFSDKPSEVGWGVERIAAAWAVLMARLGYHRYGAQGGDWGSAVTTYLGIGDAAHVAGIHLNLIAGRPEPGQSEFDESEQRALGDMTRYAEWESGYSQQQSTRPQTLAYGLNDSPAGQCAWVVEKFSAWSDCDGDPVAAFGADRLLDNVMMYWLPATAASSARLYWESLRRFVGEDARVDVPAGASNFPKEIIRSPRAWAARTYRNLQYWNELEHGGHFAAFEQPSVFVEEVRAFFRLVR